MANVLKCDRCGKEYKNKWMQSFSKAERRWFCEDNFWRSREYDLCPECTKAFEHEFMGMKPYKLPGWDADEGGT